MSPELRTEFLTEFENPAYNQWINWAEEELNKHNLTIVTTVNEEWEVFFKVTEISVEPSFNPSVLTGVVINDRKKTVLGEFPDIRWSLDIAYDLATPEQKAASISFVLTHVAATNSLFKHFHSEDISDEKFLESIQAKYKETYTGQHRWSTTPSSS